MTQGSQQSGATIGSIYSRNPHHALPISESENIHVLLVDDVYETRQIIESLLRDAEDIDVVGKAGDGREAISMTQDLRPDIVLMDINMPILDGIAATECIIGKFPEVQVIIMSVQSEHEYLRRAMLAGAREFLIKPPDQGELIRSIRHVYNLRNLPPRFSGSIQVEHHQADNDLDFYELIESISYNDHISLVAIEIEGPITAIKKILSTPANIIPNAHKLIQTSYNSLAAIVPTILVEDSIEQLINHFYEHPVVKKFPNTILTFGWSCGPCPSGDELVEAVARELIERRWSQGVKTIHKPHILHLQHRRSLLEKEYEQLLEQNKLLQEKIELSHGLIEKRIQMEVDSLTTIIHHDLSSGFNSLVGTLTQLSQQDDLSDQVKQILTEIKQQTLICTAWQRSMSEIGSPRIRQNQVIDMSSKIKEYLKIAKKYLDISVDIDDSNFRKSICITFDPQILLILCLYILLAAKEAKASVLSISSSMEDSKSLNIRFIDNGNKDSRQSIISSNSKSIYLSNVPWHYQNLCSLSSLLLDTDISIEYRYEGDFFQVSLLVSANSYNDIPTFKSISMLFTEVEQLRHTVEQLKEQVILMHVNQRTGFLKDILERAHSIFSSLIYSSDKSQPITREHKYHNQIQLILLPYVQMIEDCLQSLLQRIYLLQSLQELETDKVKRLFHLSNYCHLLIRNLMLVLRGKELILEQIDINQQIHQVIDMLEHKLYHIEISLDLSEGLPFIHISSIEAQQILMNIIKNSAEATATGGMLHVTTHILNNHVVINIMDTGIGVPLSFRDKLFELHFSSKGRGTGSGVGLYAVQSIIEKIGGKICVASAALENDGKLVTWKKGLLEDFVWTNSGTIFQIHLPISKK